MARGVSARHGAVKPEEVAAAALFLVSDDTPLVTGQLLVAESGRTIL